MILLGSCSIPFFQSQPDYIGKSFHYNMTRQSYVSRNEDKQWTCFATKVNFIKYYYILYRTGIWDETTFQSGDISEIE